jgi:phosphogluconate dehydratase
MPELHSLTPALSVLQDRGLRVALVTDGRMSGASGKVPAAIHLVPEAADGGPIARLCDGDVITLDAGAGTLAVDADLGGRAAAAPDLLGNSWGTGREMFGMFRAHATTAAEGGSVLFGGR